MSNAADLGPCLLVLEDGTVLHGRGFGVPGTRAGEVVFNTAMTGYQEILTDPSYCGQIVTMTYPLIGNYGVNEEDVESARPHVFGFVVKELARLPSNYRASMRLEDYLARYGITGIQGVDTRALTRKLRVDGAMRGVITTEVSDPVEAVRLAREAPPMEGADLVSVVAPRDAMAWHGGLDPVLQAPRGGDNGAPRRRVIAIDCGMKRNILRHLTDIGCEVQVVPPVWSAEQVLAGKPDGLFVSNGPGDPAAVRQTIQMLQGLAGRVPIFGICLGHQLLGLALGAKTYKLKFGHHGANHPVRNLGTGRIEITSQNHGFAVETQSLERAGGVPTHINLYDHTLEGFAHRELPLFAVQYHPEAAPGPHDASYLFDCFATMMRTQRPPTAEEMARAQADSSQRGGKAASTHVAGQL